MAGTPESKTQQAGLDLLTLVPSTPNSAQAKEVKVSKGIVFWNVKNLDSLRF